MSSLTIKMMAGSPPPATELIGSNAKRPAAVSVKPPTLPLQVRVKEVKKLEAAEKTSLNVSRRDFALFLTAGSLSAVTLSSPKPAEARMSRSEMRKMILENFEKLREKVGLSKPKTEENDKVPAPTPPLAKKETTPASPVPSGKVIPVPPPSEPPLPNLQNDKKPVMEATILP